MTYDNIKLKTTDRGDGVKVQSIITPFLQPFIEKLALKYPQWTFEEDNTSNKWENINGKSVKSELVATHFKVLDKREELGTIGKEWASKGYRFQVDNHRINAMRERGSGMKTIHLDKAIKHVSKFVGKKNINEKLSEARQVAESGLSNVTNHKQWKMRELWLDDVISAELQKYLVSVFPDALTMLDPKVIKGLEDFPTRVTERLEVDDMTKQLRLGNMHLVLLDGMDYALQKGIEPPTIKASEQLPDYMRRAIGLLKLVEDNQVINGVGYRANATTFMVVNKEEV
jgi:hypothetical protein